MGVSRKQIQRGPFFLTAPLFAVTIIVAITTLVSIDRPLSVYHSIRLFLLFGLYLYVINEVKGIREIIWPVSIQVVIQAAVSIAQFINQHSIGLYQLGEYQLDPAWNGVSVVLAGGVRYLRGYGLTDHPNILGGAFAFGLLLMAARFAQKEEASKRYWLAAGIIIGALGLFTTFSRAAVLGGLLGGALILFLIHRNKLAKERQRLIGLVLATLVFVIPVVWSNRELVGVRIGSNNSFEHVETEIGSLKEREALNQIANEVFVNDAISGIGIGSLPQAMRWYRPEFQFYYQPAHIALLDVAVETGLFGALFYSILLVAPWVALIGRRGENLTLDLIGVSGALLAATVIGLFDYYTWLLIPGRLWQWTIWGLWGAFFMQLNPTSQGTVDV
jgi:O-antigen ligase